MNRFVVHMCMFLLYLCVSSLIKYLGWFPKPVGDRDWVMFILIGVVMVALYLPWIIRKKK
ncbi:hypothetical protein BC351_00880 [Paenibacillus ferrarius]|uniref:Uncharacterized protein n=1 Tax=Paenibacillus ferrarius TaxID=1469647 RepID=A0A1V4HSH8_9BACL|nr:hypothetical protein BC351_00880 [Paenibacillus ferrarius]